MTISDSAIHRLIGFITGRQKDYRLAFSGPAGQRVLQDLAKFCRANETCFVPGDSRLSDALEGRREVWLRVQQNLNLTPDQLAEVYAGHIIKIAKDADDV